MEMTRFRWVAALVIGALLVSIYGMREPAEMVRHRDLERDNLLTRTSFYHRVANRLSERLRVQDLRDSVYAALPIRSSSSGVNIAIAPGLPDDFVQPVNRLVRNASQLVRSTGELPITVVVAYELPTKRDGVIFENHSVSKAYLLPRHAGEPCYVILRLPDVSTNRAFRSSVLSYLSGSGFAERLLGPCAYYRAFGMPGTHISQWLRDRAFMFTREGRWDRPSPPELLRSRRGMQTFQSLYLNDREWPTPLLAELSALGAQCVLGDPAPCEPILLRRPRRASAPLVYAENILTDRSISNQGELGALGAREFTLLADMVRDLGRERFASFWKSSEPVPAAFQNAAGQSLGQWTSNWARDAYPIEAKPGPATPAPTAMASVLIILLCAGLAIGLNSRRQFA